MILPSYYFNMVLYFLLNFYFISSNVAMSKFFGSYTSYNKANKVLALKTLGDASNEMQASAPLNLMVL